MSSSESSSDDIRLNVSQLRKYLGQRGTRRQNEHSPSPRYASASSSQRGGGEARGGDKLSAGRGSRLGSRRSTTETGNTRLSPGLSARGIRSSRDKLSPRLRRLASESLRASSSDEDDIDGDYGNLQLTSALLSKALQQRKALASQANSMASSNAVTRSPEASSPISQRTRNEQTVESNVSRRQSSVTSGLNATVDRSVRRASLQARFSQPLHDPVDHVFQKVPRSQSIGSTAAAESPPLPPGSSRHVELQPAKHRRSFGSQPAQLVERHSLDQHIDTSPESVKWASSQQTPPSRNIPIFHSTASITRGSIEASNHLAEKHDAAESPSHDPEDMSSRSSFRLPETHVNGVASRSLEILSSGKGINSNQTASVGMHGQHRSSVLDAVPLQLGGSSADQPHRGQIGPIGKALVPNRYVDLTVAPLEDVVAIPCHPSREFMIAVSGATVSEAQRSPLLPTGPRAEAKSAAHASYSEGEESSDSIRDADAMASGKAVRPPAVRQQAVHSRGCVDAPGRLQLQRPQLTGTVMLFSQKPQASDERLPCGNVVDRMWNGSTNTYGSQQRKREERMPARRLETSVEGAVRAVLGVAEKSSDESPPMSPSRLASRPPSQEASTGATAKKHTRFLQLGQNNVSIGMQDLRHTTVQQESPGGSTKHRRLSGSPDRPQAASARPASSRPRVGFGASPAAVPPPRARSEGGGVDSKARGLQSQRSLVALALPLMPAPRWRSFTNDIGDSQVAKKAMRSAGSSPQRGSRRHQSADASKHALQAAIAGAGFSRGAANLGSQIRQLSSPVAARGAAASRRAVYDSSSSDGGSAPSLDCTVPSLGLGEARVIGPSTSAATTSVSTLDPALPSFSFPVHDDQLRQSGQHARAGGTGPSRKSTDETAQGSTRGILQCPGSPRDATDATSPVLVHSPVRHLNDTGQVRHAQHYRGIVPPLEIPVAEWSRLRAGPMLAVLSSPASPSSSPPSSPRRQNVTEARTSKDDKRYGHSPGHSPDRCSIDGLRSSGERNLGQPDIASRSSSNSVAGVNNRSHSAAPSFKVARPVTAAAAIAAAGAALLRRLSRAPSAAARMGSARATVDSGTVAPTASPIKSPAAGLATNRETSSGGSMAGGGGPARASSPISPKSLSPRTLDNVGQQAGNRVASPCVPEPAVGGQWRASGLQTAYAATKPADADIAARFTTVAQRSREGRYVRSPPPVPPVAPASGSDAAAGSPRNRRAYGQSLLGPWESVAGLAQHTPFVFPRADGACSGQNEEQSLFGAGSGLGRQPVASSSRRSGSPKQMLQDAALSPGRWSGSELGRAHGRRYASSPSPSQFRLDALARSIPKEARADGFPSSGTSHVPVALDQLEQVGTNQWFDELLRQVNSSGSGTSEDGLRLLMSLSSTHSLSPLVRHAFRSGSSTQLDAGAEADAAILRQLADVQRDMEHIMCMTQSASAKAGGPSFETLGLDPAVGQLAVHGPASPSRPSSWSSGTSTAATAASASLAQTLAALQQTVRMEAAAANVRSARARASSPPLGTSLAASAVANALHRRVSPFNISPAKSPEAGAAAQTGNVSATGLQTRAAALSKPARKVEPLVLPRVTSPSSPRIQQQIVPRQVSASLLPEAFTAAWSPPAMFFDIGTTSAREQISREAARRSRSTPRIYGSPRQSGRYGSSGDRTSMRGAGSSGGGLRGSADGPRSRAVSTGGERSPRYPLQHHISMGLGAFGKLSSGGGASSAHGGSSLSPDGLLRHYGQRSGYTQPQAAHALGGAISGGAIALGLRPLSALDLTEIKRGLSNEASHAGFLASLRETVTDVLSPSNMRPSYESPRRSPNTSSLALRTPRLSPSAVSTPKASMSAFGAGFPGTQLGDTAVVTGVMMGSSVRHDPVATDRTSARSVSPGGSHAVPKPLSPQAAPPAFLSSVSPKVSSHRENTVLGMAVATSIPNTVPARAEPITGATGRATFAWPAASEGTPGGVAPRGPSPLRGDASIVRPQQYHSSARRPAGMASGRNQSPTGIRPESSLANSFSTVRPAARPLSIAASGVPLGSGSPGRSANASKAPDRGRSAGLESLSRGPSTGSSAAGATRLGTAVGTVTASTATGAGGAMAVAAISPLSHPQPMVPPRSTLSGLPSTVQPSHGATTIAAGGATRGRRILSLLTTADVLPYSSEQGTRMFSPRHSSDAVSRGVTASTPPFAQAGHRKLLAAAAMVGAGEQPTLADASETHRGRVHHPDPSLIRVLQLLRSTKASSSSSNAGGSNPGSGGGGSGTGSSFGGSHSSSCSAASIFGAINGASLSTLHSYGSGSDNRSSSAHASSSSRNGRRSGGRRYVGCGQFYGGSVRRTKATGGLRSPRYNNTWEHACKDSIPLLQRFQQEQRLLPTTTLVPAGSRHAGNVGSRCGSVLSLASASFLNQAEDSTGRLTEYSFAPGLEISSGTLGHTPPTADSDGSETSGSDSDDSTSQNGVYGKLSTEMDLDSGGGVTGATGLGAGVIGGSDCSDGGCVAASGVRSLSPENGLPEVHSSTSSNVEDARDEGETQGQSSSSPPKGPDRGVDETQDGTDVFSPTAGAKLTCASLEAKSASPSQQQHSELANTSLMRTSSSGPVAAAGCGSSALGVVLVSCEVTMVKPCSSPTVNMKSPRQVQCAVRDAESDRWPEQADATAAATATHYEEVSEVEEAPGAQKSTANASADCGLQSVFGMGELHLPPLLAERQHLHAVMALPKCADKAPAIDACTDSCQSARGDSAAAALLQDPGISCNLSRHAGESLHDLLVEQQVRISALPLSAALVADPSVLDPLGQPATVAQPPPALAAPTHWPKMDANQVLLGDGIEYLVDEGGSMSNGKSSNSSRCVESDANIMAQMLTASVAEADSPVAEVAGAPATAALLLRAEEIAPMICTEMRIVHACSCDSPSGSPYAYTRNRAGCEAVASIEAVASPAAIRPAICRNNGGHSHEDLTAGCQSLPARWSLEASRDGVCVCVSASRSSRREHFEKRTCTPHGVSSQQQQCHLNPGRPASHYVSSNDASVPGECPGAHSKCQGFSSEGFSYCGVGQSAVATVDPSDNWDNAGGWGRDDDGDGVEQGIGGDSCRSSDREGWGDSVRYDDERSGDVALQKDGNNDGFSTKGSDHGTCGVNDDGVPVPHPASSDSECEESGPMATSRRLLKAAVGLELGASSGSGTQCRAASSKDGHEYLPLSRVKLQDHRHQGQNVDGDNDTSQSSDADRVSPALAVLAPELPGSTSASRFIFDSRTDTGSLPSGVSLATIGPRSSDGHSASRPQDAAENAEQDPEPEPDVSPDLHKRGGLRETATYRRVDLIAADLTFSGYPNQGSHATATAAIAVTGGARVVQGKTGGAILCPQHATMMSPVPQQRISQAGVVLARELNDGNGVAAVRPPVQPSASYVFLARTGLVPHSQPAPSRTAAPLAASPTLSNLWVATQQARARSGVTPSGIPGATATAAALSATPVNASQVSASVHCSDGPETRSGTRLGPMARALLRYAAQDSSESSPRCWTDGPVVREEETGDSRAETSSPCSLSSSAPPSGAPSIENQEDSGEKDCSLLSTRLPEGALHPRSSVVVHAMEDGQATAAAIPAAGVTSKATAVYTRTDADIAITAAAATSDVPSRPASRSTVPSTLTVPSAKSASAAISVLRDLISADNSATRISEIPHVAAAPPAASVATYQLRLDSELSPDRRNTQSRLAAEFPPYPVHPRDTNHGPAEVNVVRKGYDLDYTEVPSSVTSSQFGPPSVEGSIEQLAAAGKIQSEAHSQDPGSSSQPLNLMGIRQSQAHHQQPQPVLASVFISEPQQDQCQQPRPLPQQRPPRQLLLQPQQMQKGIWMKGTPQRAVATASPCHPGNMLPRTAAPMPHTCPSSVKTFLHVSSCPDKIAALPTGSITSSAAIICRPRLSCTLVGPFETVGQESSLEAPLYGGYERLRFRAGHGATSYASPRSAHDINIEPQGHGTGHALERSSGQGQVSALQHAPAQGQGRGLQHPPRPALEEKSLGWGRSHPNTAQPGFQKGLACSGRVAVAGLGKEDIYHGEKEDFDCGTLGRQAGMGSMVGQQASVSVHGVLAAQAAPAIVAVTQPQKGVQSRQTVPALMPQPLQPQPVAQRLASSVLVASLQQLNSATQSVCARMLELYYQEAGSS